MLKDLSNYRKSYKKKELLESNCPENPIQLFQTWFLNADSSEAVDESNAMTIASIGLDGFPKNRVVLLKKYTWEGFIFYTNYNSRKGQELQENPFAALLFFWDLLEQQVRIEGRVAPLPTAQSDAYFASRPIDSQIGALASPQSTVIPNRQSLLDTVNELQAKHKANVPIVRPSYWGGFIVKPVEIEFWQGRANRLHDRIRYKLDSEYNWIIERLAP